MYDLFVPAQKHFYVHQNIKKAFQVIGLAVLAASVVLRRVKELISLFHIYKI
jgi:hypothetical protein